MVISTILFFFIIYTVQDLVLGVNGYSPDVWYLSITLYTGILLQVDIKICVMTRTWTVFNFIALVAFSLIIYLIFVFIGDISIKFFPDISYTAGIVFGSGIAWCIWVLFTGVSL